MRFGEWLKTIGEAQTQGNTPGRSVLGPASMAVDNRAVRSVVGGIGDAMSKMRARDGAEPAAAQGFDRLGDVGKDIMHTVYMPLQDGKDRAEGDRPYYMSKSLVLTVRNLSDDPLKDHGMYQVDGTNANIANRGADGMKTRLYEFHKDKINKNDFDSAINYTTALMQASLMAKLGKYSHLIDLERPRIAERRLFPVKAGADGMFNQIMMCAFVFHPIDKHANLDRNIHDDIEGLVAGGQQAQNKQASGANANRGQSNLNASRPNTRTTNVVPASSPNQARRSAAAGVARMVAQKNQNKGKP